MTDPFPIKEFTGHERFIIQNNMKQHQIEVREFKRYPDGSFMQQFKWETVREVQC